MMKVIVCLLASLSLLVPSIVQGEVLVRLSGGATPLEGRVEVLKEREWGLIGTDQWDQPDANVVCRQLGFETAAEYTTSGGEFDPADLTTPIHIRTVTCTGDEVSLSQCSYSSVLDQQVGRSLQYAGVRCAGEHTLRLTGDNSGELQVLLPEGNWVGVCADGWTSLEAAVACRELGYQQGVLNSVTVSGAPEGTVTSANCSGSEFNLRSCDGYSVTPQTCSSIVTLQCMGFPSTPTLPVISNITCTTATVTWAPPPDNGSPISTYTVRYRDITSSGSLWAELNVTGTEAALAGLTPGGVYHVGVGAENSVGGGAFSESALFITPVPGPMSPVNLNADHITATAVNISWTVPVPCGIQIHSYELKYHSTTEQDKIFTHTVLASTNQTSESSVTLSHALLEGLGAFTEYQVRVRVHGTTNTAVGQGFGDMSEGVRGEGASQMVVSDFSDMFTFRTLEDVPGASPTGFSAFLRYSAHFRWGPVPENQSNGIITYYSVTCLYQSNGLPRQTSRNVSNTTFTLEINELMRDTRYECSVAAGTRVGPGPHSVSVLFTTPVDLNVPPSPPRNVAFPIIAHSDSTRPEIILQARWAIQDCETELNCPDIIGYSITCRRDSEEEEIRHIVWQYEVEELRGSLASVNLSVRPFTRYRCFISSISGNGVLGNPGSIVVVDTNELAPSLSPSQLYVTEILPNSVRVHWTYSDPDPVGDLIGFQMDIYYQDINNPSRIDNALFYHRELYEIPSHLRTQLTEFSFNVMYLLPASSYIMVVSAVSRAGAGPGTRIVLTTNRTVPTRAPTPLLYSVRTHQEPFLFQFTWELTQPTSISGQSMVHTGFNIICSVNESITGFLPAGSNIVTQTVFTSVIEDSYTANVFVPTNCDVRVTHYSCAVKAFNERGEGPLGPSMMIPLPCDFNSDPFSGSILANPYFSVVFLSFTLLLLISLVIYSLAVCLYCKRNKNRIEEEKHYSTVNEIYDESYIPMAPSSDVNFKPTWTRNFSIAQRMVPPIPLSARSSLEGTDMGNNDNTYDEIPGDRIGGGGAGGANHTHQQPNNHYAEIIPQASPIVRPGVGSGSSRRGSGHMSAASRPTSGSAHMTAPLPSTTRHSGSRRGSRDNNPLQQHAAQLDDSTATTTTALSRFELSLSTNQPSQGASEASDMCAGTLLQPSTSNTTSLSGNDYVEVTSHGETRPLTKRTYNSSGSLSKSAASVGKLQFSADGVGHTEVKYNPYDNIPEVRTPKGALGSCEGEGCEKGEAGGEGEGAGERRKSGSSACCHSDFVEFIDNMEDRRESLASCLSPDPPYVAMSECGGHQGAAAALQQDTHKDKHTQ